MRVFHGSYMEIDSVDLNKCHANKDFGRGFYVTKYRKQAEDWAEIIGKAYGTAGFVTEFTFYEWAFTDESFKVLRFDRYDDAWFDFVILNRNLENPQQKHDYDIIEGPVADDKVQRRITRFLQGKITRKKFFEQLTQFPEPTHQICFCTINSLRMLKKINHEQIIELEDIGEFIVEKLVANFGLDDETATEKFFSSETFLNLADSKNKFYEKPWTEIYEMLKAELDK